MFGAHLKLMHCILFEYNITEIPHPLYCNGEYININVYITSKYVGWSSHFTISRNNSETNLCNRLRESRNFVFNTREKQNW